MTNLPLRCFAVCITLALPAAAQPGDETKPAPAPVPPAGAAAAPAAPAAPTAPEEGTPKEKPKRQVQTTFGVNPQDAQLGSEASMPGAAEAQEAQVSGKWKFGFHGYLRAPMR